MKPQKKKLDENTVKVVKISKDALFEFIYEQFIENQEVYLDVDALEVSNTFAINFERGEFIFCACKAEDAKGEMLEFPKEIDLQRLMTALEDTACSMYAGDRYREYTKKELIELSKKP